MHSLIRIVGISFKRKCSWTSCHSSIIPEWTETAPDKYEISKKYKKCNHLFRKTVEHGRIAFSLYESDIDEIWIFQDDTVLFHWSKKEIEDKIQELKYQVAEADQSKNIINELEQELKLAYID